MQLQKWQRNTIFRAVVDGELDPAECTFDYDDVVSRITHVPSGSYFVLEGDPSRYTATSVVGDDIPRAIEAFTWVGVEDRVRQWARVAKQDVDTPDLWAELQWARDRIGGASADFENTPFTPEEQAQIARELNAMKRVIRETYQLTAEQYALLDAKLDVLAEATGRLGRMDWQDKLVGALIGYVITVVLPPEPVRHVLYSAIRVLVQLPGSHLPDIPGIQPPGPMA